MPLSAYTIRTENIRLSKDNDFKVRAVTFPDLALLVQDRMPELIAIVAKYHEGRQEFEEGGKVDRKTLTDLALLVVRDFPSFTTEIISCCIYDEVVTPEMRNKVNSLPIAVQLDAIGKIVKLSVEEAGGLKNLLSDLQSTLNVAMTTGEGGPMTTAGMTHTSV